MGRRTFTRRDFLRVSALATAGLAAASCTQAAPTAAPAPTKAPASQATSAPAAATKAPAAQKFIKFGMSVALSGALSKEGSYCRDGVQLWKELVNEAGGIKVGGEQYLADVIFYDDKSDAETGAKLTEKLITEDKVNFLLGPFNSGLAMLTTTVGEKYKTLTMCTMSNASSIFTRGYKYCFAVLPPAGNYMRLFIDMALAQNPKPATAAVVLRDDAFGNGMAPGTVAYATQKGLQVLYNQKYPADIKDASTLLTDLKKLNPDVLIGCTNLQDAVLLTRQAKELAFCPSAIAYAVGPTMPGFTESLAKDAEYIYGSEWWLPAMGWKGRGIFKSSMEFAEIFEKKYNYKPSYHPAGSAAAAEIIRLCIEDTGSLDTETIRNALLKFDEEIFWGPHAHAENGENRKGGSAPVQIQDGAVMCVYPEATAQAKPRWPMPCWDKR